MRGPKRLPGVGLALKLPTALKESLGPWDTSTYLVDGSGLPIYGEIVISMWIQNIQFHTEFSDSKVSDKGILVIAYLVEQSLST